MRRKWLVTIAAICGTSSQACPFCDYGAQDTAIFIVTLFGFFVFGMIGVLFLFIRKGGWGGSEAASRRVLEVDKGEKNDGFRS